MKNIRTIIKKRMGRSLQATGRCFNHAPCAFVVHAHSAGDVGRDV